MNRRMFLASLVMPVLAGCSARAPVRSTPDRYVRRGLASWYGDAFDGKPTASGEPFDSNQFTTAHYDLPFDSRVRVRNLNNDREVELRVNDRVPLEALNNGRILDISYAAARQLEMVEDGVVPIEITVLAWGPLPVNRATRRDRRPRPRDRSTAPSRHPTRGCDQHGAPHNVASSLDSARELEIRDAQPRPAVCARETSDKQAVSGRFQASDRPRASQQRRRIIGSDDLWPTQIRQYQLARRAAGAATGTINRRGRTSSISPTTPAGARMKSSASPETKSTTNLRRPTGIVDWGQVTESASNRKEELANASRVTAPMQTALCQPREPREPSQDTRRH